jgi:hypothetical protein
MHYELEKKHCGNIANVAIFSKVSAQQGVTHPLSCYVKRRWLLKQLSQLHSSSPNCLWRILSIHTHRLFQTIQSARLAPSRTVFSDKNKS